MLIASAFYKFGAVVVPQRCVSLLSFVVEGTTMNIVTSQTQGTYTYEQVSNDIIGVLT